MSPIDRRNANRFDGSFPAHPRTLQPAADRSPASRRDRHDSPTTHLKNTLNPRTDQVASVEARAKVSADRPPKIASPSVLSDFPTESKAKPSQTIAPEKFQDMKSGLKLRSPWLVAVWPGMGHVALSAGYYLMAKLGMNMVAEFGADDAFDVEHVEVKSGLIQSARMPRSRFFAWTDPAQKNDLIVFIGEAQPSIGKFAFCRRLIQFAKAQGVERIFTFAAMATQMHPEKPSRVFAAAAEPETLAELNQYDVDQLEDGHIGGLNGLLIGAAAEAGLRGACLLGEMPHIFVQLPFPKASLAVLEIFIAIAGVELDLTELRAQSREMGEKLSELLTQVDGATEQPSDDSDDEMPVFDSPEPDSVRPEDRARIEFLFKRAQADRSVAYELKRELDRLNLYRENEDRFLDLFDKPSEPD
jgi:proteasome assembly chaperone (PAC2) family protein